MADPKEIAKVANHVLAGIGGVVAGAFMGPVGAEGVDRAAGGVDRLIDIAAPGAPAAKPAAVISQPSVPRKDSVMPPNSGTIDDPDGERAMQFLSQRGWSADDLTQLISRASARSDPAVAPEPPPASSQVGRTRLYTVTLYRRSDAGRPYRVFRNLTEADAQAWLIEMYNVDPDLFAVADPPLDAPQLSDVAVGAGSLAPQLPAGVTMDDVGYWLRALSWEDAELHPELRQQYLTNLRAAVDAASTPGVTPEDIAFWIHVFRTPQLPDAQRRDCRRNILEGLRALGVLEPPASKPLGATA